MPHHFKGVGLHFKGVGIHFNGISRHFKGVGLRFKGVAIHFKGHTLQFVLFAAPYSRHRKNENVFKTSKDEKCTCKTSVFHCQICKFVGFLWPSSSWLLKLPSLAPREELTVFAYQIWKPEFLSVVQFPFDNCHSPFSPTTFFEVGVYLNW